MTSARTFSGGEEFVYDLKTQKRATLIGETTGGGANPGSAPSVNPRFSIFVPTGRAENPITKTNWERTGVTPDMAVSRDQAFRVAMLKPIPFKILLQLPAGSASASMAPNPRKRSIG